MQEGRVATDTKWLYNLAMYLPSPIIYNIVQFQLSMMNNINSVSW